MSISRLLIGWGWRSTWNETQREAIEAELVATFTDASHITPTGVEIQVGNSAFQSGLTSYYSSE